jgi:hypothetical protein
MSAVKRAPREVGAHPARSIAHRQPKSSPGDRVVRLPNGELPALRPAEHELNERSLLTAREDVHVIAG